MKPIFKQLAQQQQRFEHLTRPWRDRLWGVALRRTEVRSKAEDWVQETLLRAWRDFSRLEDNIAIFAWLLKILDHVIADDIRRETRRHQLAPMQSTEALLLQEQSSLSPGPFEAVLQAQSDEQVIKAIKSLSDEYSAVILLRDIEGLSYKEVAEILNIPPGTVMSRLSRGRRLLAASMLNDEVKNTAKIHFLKQEQREKTK
ncbi:RNA polymerase sigma factor [sulfur-oxidizing endosymbiont of Gigantopelta aegis]|uniref:RNA polymerase sigma factor n=1 Tax=sulfur-oxidizing endosymbiont of Gigantopelta aegis TaxID=2794934 RepID=UPI0018DDE0AD|nr:sigma-70 family RNA polymerase sigma factor [sulfur-oxidizing endosymbiont of Gigantopelta aegis]